MAAKNVTIAIDEDTLRASREYAKQRGISLNALIRELLERTTQCKNGDWVNDWFALLDSIPKNDVRWSWDRDEIYEERLGRWPKRS